MTNSDHNQHDIPTRKTDMSSDEIKLLIDIQTFIIGKSQATGISPAHMVVLMAHITGLMCNRIGIGLGTYAEMKNVPPPPQGYVEYLRTLVHKNVDEAINQDIPFNDETKEMVKAMSKLFAAMSEVTADDANEDTTNVKH